MTDYNLEAAINSCIASASECNHCAISCLEEEHAGELKRCIRLNLECSIISRLTAEMLNLHTKYSKEIAQICADVSEACANECATHSASDATHCKECEETCRKSYTELNVLQNQLVIAEEYTTYAQIVPLLTRAAAELMSLESTYCQAICELTKTVADDAAKAVEAQMQEELSYLRHCASFAAGGVDKDKISSQAGDTVSETLVDGNIKSKLSKAEIEEKNKKSSVIFGASLWRSPVNQAKSHINRDVLGNSGAIGNTETMITYDN